MINIIDGNTFEAEVLLKLRNQGADREVRNRVVNILEDIRLNGDAALFKYCRLFDNTELGSANIKLNRDEVRKAYNEVEPGFVDIVKKAKANIEEFHLKQVQKSWMMTREGGSMLGQIVRPIESVGIYVPGGTASYPSSVLMNAIPAKIAGVKRIAMATPCRDSRINPYTLVAAGECGIDEIYKIGGAQAIASLAYGTESVPRVSKIVGPGNVYVAAAKREVYGYVDIDMIAGPSEILIIADENANPAFIAADIMSQAEHDERASAVLVTVSEKLIDEVVKELKKQSSTLSREDTILKSLREYGYIVKVPRLEDAVRIANIAAPEHLEVMAQNPVELLDGIKNAGSIFLGEYSPEPLGDYFAGPNHVLPTGGTAAFFSPLSVDSFIKKSSYIYYSKKGLQEVKDDVQKFACYEGLTAHANSVKVRF